MAVFALRGVTLEIPETALRGGLRAALQSGRYEHGEADGLMQHLIPGDRLLDLGAGLGYLCCLASRVLGADCVTGIEAGAQAAAMARANLDRNGFGAARIITGAVVPDRHPGGMVGFGERPAFWASALARDDMPANARLEQVAAMQIGTLLAVARPTVLSCDIEGAELEVLATRLPPPVRLIVVEMHPAIYGGAGVRALGNGLAAQGFRALPRGTKDSVVVFQRA